MSELGFPQPVPGGDDPAIAPIDTVGGKSLLGTNTSGQTKRLLVDSNNSLNVHVTDDDGITVTDFDYVAGTLTSAGSVIGIGRCRGIRVFANGVDSRFAISGGTPINLRSNQIFYHIPQGILTNPTIDWFSGSLDVWMEVEGSIAPTTPDLGLSLGIAHL